MRNSVHLLLILTLLVGQAQGQDITYQTESLKIIRLSPQTFVHVSYLNVPDYGRVPCNGLVFVDGQEAVVVDTPTNDSASVELIRWVEGPLASEVRAVVVTHFHDDCLAGLAAFHSRAVPSYATYATVELARKNDNALPSQGFDSLLEITVGNKKVVNQFFGEGHTTDNIVSYLPSEEVLFGGCLIKEVGAGKGNLADANLSAWANTVRRIKQTYPNVKYVVPGHGTAGGMELLDYTAKMFSEF